MESVRVVAMQPFVRLQGFHWDPGHADRQMNAIQRTLELSRPVSGQVGSTFTLFPEYTIPGVGGAQLIDDSVRDPGWQNGSVVIGGVHGLGKDEYRELCESLTAEVLPVNAPDAVGNDQWVNCCATWIKDDQGEVKVWVQPKIKPSKPEIEIGGMFCGSGIYLFRGRYQQGGFPCYWITLICFDWIASGPTPVLDTILQTLDEQQSKLDEAGGLPLHFVFVIQHNKKPNHEVFLRNTASLLTDARFPWVERSNTVILHANTAGSLVPKRGGDYGFTACVFSPRNTFMDGCRLPTVCQKWAKKLRNRNDLGACSDVVFREMGACVHRFSLRVPKFVTATVGDRTLPLDRAEVFSTEASAEPDPRLSGQPVPAEIKWLNDSLDELQHFSERVMCQKPLEAAAIAFEADLQSQVRDVGLKNAASRIVTWSTCPEGQQEEDEHDADPDLWGQRQTDGFEHVCHSLTGLGLAYDVKLDQGAPHGVLQSKDSSSLIRVVTIRGDDHVTCRQYFDRRIRKTLNDPILIVSRDHDNSTPTPEEFRKYFEPEGHCGTRFLDFQTLRQRCTNATDGAALRTFLDEFLPKDGRII